MSEPFVGEIRIVGFNFAPQGWSFCDGSLLPIAQNEVLFNLIGTTYGGDGVNTFALPNLQGRIPIHQGSSPSNGQVYIQGQLSGSESVALTAQQIPSHNHVFQVSAAAATSGAPSAGSVPGQAASNIYASTASTTTMSSTSLAGGGQPHDNMMPFLCVNYVISFFGIFPSQG
jgi:microcystin-dependent protein